MSPLQLVWLSIAVSTASVIVLFLRCGARDILPYMAAYFAFFGLGPAINFARDEEIYFRIDLDGIGKASVGLALALAAMAVTGLLIPPRTEPLAPATSRTGDRTSVETTPRLLPFVPATLFGLAAYAIAIIALRGPQMLQLDKIARIDVAGSLHYRYLLVEFFACSLYFVARHRRLDRIAYWTNLACYTAYCLMTRERDFIFILFALLLYLLVLQGRGNIVALAVAASAFILVATYLAGRRSGREFGVTSALNEGSVLIVDTLVMGLVPSTYQFLMGQSYLDALLSLPPGFLIGDRGSLGQWLIDTVAPSSPSGYGFSMTAEAYINFGMPAVPVVFGAVTALQRYLLARAPRGPFPTYLSMLFTITWMYNFRGESRAFLVSIAGGVLFYGAVTLFALRGARDASEVAPAPGPDEASPPPAHPAGVPEAAGRRSGRPKQRPGRPAKGPARPETRPAQPAARPVQVAKRTLRQEKAGNAALSA